jgi:hypothetical protein
VLARPGQAASLSALGCKVVSAHALWVHFLSLSIFQNCFELIQILEIHINLNIAPKFLKPALLWF